MNTFIINRHCCVLLYSKSKSKSDNKLSQKMKQCIIQTVDIKTEVTHITIHPS
jgi:hypothetical protein